MGVCYHVYSLNSTVQYTYYAEFCNHAYFMMSNHSYDYFTSFRISTALLLPLLSTGFKPIFMRKSPVNTKSLGM